MRQDPAVRAPMIETIRTFTALSEEFVELFMKHHPVAATEAGIHDYDHLMPDDSPDGLANRAAWLRDLDQRLVASVPWEELPLEPRVDFALLRSRIAALRLPALPRLDGARAEAAVGGHVRDRRAVDELQARARAHGAVHLRRAGARRARARGARARAPRGRGSAPRSAAPLARAHRRGSPPR